jgi:hypothetical protein
MAAVEQDAYPADRMDGFLDYLLAEWAEVPLLAEEWRTWSTNERLDFAQDWPIREDRLLQVQAAAEAGRLTSKQKQQYRRVQNLAAQHRPLLDRLFQDIGLPTSSLWGAVPPRV